MPSMIRVAACDTGSEGVISNRSPRIDAAAAEAKGQSKILSEDLDVLSGCVPDD
jgi:hypothetical protein